MSDKMDKSLENKGWQQMKIMLDEAMPSSEKKRKKRFFVWFILSGLMLIFAGLGAAYFYGKNGEDQFPKPQNSSANPIATQTGKFPEGEKIDNFKSENFISETKIPIPEIQPDLTKKITRISSDKNFQIIDNQVFASTLPKKINEDAPSENLVLESQKPDIAFLKTLKIPSFESQKNPILFASNDPDPKKVQKENQGINFGVSAGLSSQRFSAINGFQVGLVTQIPLSKRSNFLTGLEYGQLIEPVFNYAVGSNLDSDTSSPITQDPGTYDAYEFELISNGLRRDTINHTLKLTKKVHFISLPVAFQYQIFKGLSAEVGLEGRYYFFEDPGNVNLNSNVNNQNRSAQNYLDNNVELAASGGLNYQFSRAVGVGAFYRVGLTNLSSTDGFDFYNRQIGVSGRYFFH